MVETEPACARSPWLSDSAHKRHRERASWPRRATSLVACPFEIGVCVAHPWRTRLVNLSVSHVVAIPVWTIDANFSPCSLGRQ